MLQEVVFKHFHLFCGLGGGAKGFNKGSARVGNLVARWRCLGGVDNDPAAISDFDKMARARGTVMDLFTRDQYRAFHGHEPPIGWREATPLDMHAAAGNEAPDAVFLSSPCKGNSGLLPESVSVTPKYRALNELTLRGFWLALEAWKDDPPALIIFENVPRIAQRSRHLLDQVNALLAHYGYLSVETKHDCGEIGGLGQSRKRFLLVARHREKVPNFLYEPPKKRLLGVGEVIGRFPLPGPDLILPMHRMPSLQWKTWVRLAFVEAGSDWRSLNKLAVEDGYLKDFGIVADTDWHGGVLGVNKWDEAAGVVAGRSSPTNGSYSVADPRVEGHPKSVQLGVRSWGKPTGVVKGDMSVGTGPYAISDPRLLGRPRFNNTFRIVKYRGSSPAIAGPGGPGGGLAVADPRPAPRDDYKQTKYRVTAMKESAGTVIGASTTGNGAYAVADPRPGKETAGLQGNWHMTPYEGPAHAVVGNRKSGASAVADVRMNWGENAHGSKMAVKEWEGEPANTVSGARFGSGGGAVADPRPTSDLRNDAFGVRQFEDSTGTVQGESLPSNGAFSVADPRPDAFKDGKEDYTTGGHYGVQRWKGSSGAVSAHAKNNNGAWSIADPRLPEELDSAPAALPALDDRLVAMIRALDGTWHRPFTTLELAALQSLVDPEEVLELDGLSDSAWRERIGNAVPPDAAAAIAGVMARTLLLAMTGETFSLSSEPIWVRDIAVALAVNPEAQ